MSVEWLEMLLRDNEEEMRVERRVGRQIELMIARVEIYKSIIHLLKQQGEYKEAA